MNYNNKMAWYILLDPSTRQPNWTFEDVGYGMFADLDTTSTYDSKRDLWVCLSLRDFANKVRILDLANYRTCGGFVQIKVAGSWPDMSDTVLPNGAPNGASFQYVAETDCYYAYVGRGSTRIWRLRPPPGDWKTGTWTWTSEESVGPAPPRSNQNPPYQRFVWVPPLRCFIWHDDVTLRPQAWRPLAL